MALDRTKEFAAFVQACGYTDAASGFPGSGAGASLQQHAVAMSPLTSTAVHGPLRSAKESASAFTRAASAASSELHLTSMKIAKLTKLVRRRGIFEGDGGSSSAEIDALTSSIKGDVTRLNSTLDALQSFVNARKAEAERVGAQPGQPLAAPPSAAAGTSAAGGAAASGGGSSDVTNTVQGLVHSDAVLAGLKGQLLSFGGALKEVVTLRSEAIRQASQRRQHFGAGPSRDLGRPLAMASSNGGLGPASSPSGHPAAGGPFGAGGAGRGGGHGVGAGAAASPEKEPHSDFTAVSIGPGPSSSAPAPASCAAARRAAMYGGSGAGGVDMGSSLSAGAASLRAGAGGSGGMGGLPPDSSSRGHSNSHAPSSSAGAFAMVDQAQLSVDAEQEYLTARAQDMAAIESSIHELSGLFSRLAGLVAEQGAQVERIDASMDEAQSRMEAGESELRRHLQSVSSNRNLAIKVVGILVTFAIGFTMFGV